MLALLHAHRRPPSASARGRASTCQGDSQSERHTPEPYVRQAFRKYLECGIFAHGFARDAGLGVFAVDQTSLSSSAAGDHPRASTTAAAKHRKGRSADG